MPLAFAQETPEPPAEPEQSQPSDASIQRAAQLLQAIEKIDPNAEFSGNGAQFQVRDTTVIFMFDLNADRMRLMSPVANVVQLDAEELLRLMQANFDSALDARYAIANGVLWSTFIHPLASLQPELFASCLGQTVNLVDTFGTSYSSGAFIFGGGDSEEEQRKLIDELQGAIGEEI